MRLFAPYLANGESYLPPNHTLVGFDADGVSDEVDEETFRASMTVPGFSEATPDQIVSAGTGTHIYDNDPSVESFVAEPGIFEIAEDASDVDAEDDSSEDSEDTEDAADDSSEDAVKPRRGRKPKSE